MGIEGKGDGQDEAAGSGKQREVIFLRFGQFDAMNGIQRVASTLTEDRVEPTLAVATGLSVDIGEGPDTFTLKDGRRQNCFPEGKAGKAVVICRKGAVDEGGATSGDAADKQGCVDGDFGIAGKKNCIDQKPNPVQALQAKKQREAKCEKGETACR